MAWEGSTRKERLPADWPARRRAVLTRCGGQCEATMRNGRRCWDKATDVDHIRPGDDHDLTNLQGLCGWHHARKSAAEGNAARTYLTQARPAEPHPGALP